MIIKYVSIIERSRGLIKLYMKKEKNYLFDVTLKFSNSIPASNKKQALERLKESFEQEYKITLKGSEIKFKGTYK